MCPRCQIANLGRLQEMDMKIANSFERPRPRIYFARAVDGMSLDDTLTLAQVVAQELARFGLTLVDPVAEQLGLRSALKDDIKSASRQLVDFDLSTLRTCNGMLMDMSIPNRNYIGCSCELTYAYLWKIPTVVYAADSYRARPWLNYHAQEVCACRDDAISALVELLIYS